MKAVILCGGLATRMLPITKSIPKEMMPVLDKPILHHLIEKLSNEGIKDILIITTRGKECIENYFDSNPEVEERLFSTNKHDKLEELHQIANLANIHFIRQISPKGTGHAVLRAKGFVGNEDFLLLYGDELMYNPQKSVSEQLIEKYKNNNNNLTIGVKRIDIEESFKYGMIKLNENGKVEKIVEKPKPQNAPSNLCFLGSGVFKPQIFDYIKVDNEELGIVGAINDYAKTYNVEVQEIEGERFDVGNKLGLVKANLFFGLKDESIAQEVKDYMMELLNLK